MTYEPQFSQPRKRREKSEEGCKIITKRKSDGTVVKELKGKCSREQLEALSKMDADETKEF